MKAAWFEALVMLAVGVGMWVRDRKRIKPTIPEKYLPAKCKKEKN